MNDNTKVRNYFKPRSLFSFIDGPHGFTDAGTEGCLDEISGHVREHIGPVEKIFHELIADVVHIDVLHVNPTPQRPYHTLITSGMSNLPMAVPEGLEESCYAELMITLPSYWQIDVGSFQDENWYWPLRQLKFLARFPHRFNTWLGWGHTVSNGDPPRQYAPNTGLAGMIVLLPVEIPETFYELEIDNRKTIHFYCIVPVYAEEIDLKLQKGTDALLDRFDFFNVSEIVDPVRRKTAKLPQVLFKQENRQNITTNLHIIN